MAKNSLNQYNPYNTSNAGVNPIYTQNITSTGGTFTGQAVYPNTTTSTTGVAMGFGAVTTQLESMRKMLYDDAQAKLQGAVEYRDAILLQKKVRLPLSTVIVLKGAKLHPIIIGYASDPTSFEWYLDEFKECKEDWIPTAVYEIPSKHKFLDSNILPGQGYIIPMELVLRPIDLSEDRFFFSWYGGFVVENSSIHS